MIARSRLAREKCGYLADVGKARTSTRCVAPSLDSKPRNCSSDRVECPIVYSLTGSTLHEAPAFDPRRTGWGRDASRTRLVQRLTPKENPGCSHIVPHVDQQKSEIATAP